VGTRRVRVERAARLRGVPMFAECSDKELALVDMFTDDLGVAAGDVLIHQGEFGYEAFVIVSGEARVTIDDVEVARLGPGEFFGEMAMLNPTTERCASVQALTPMRVLVASRRTFNGLLEITNVATWMLRSLATRLSAAQSARTSIDQDAFSAEDHSREHAS
jgi:CRP/FNR family transcriptional regulator, cyclic AMP receptor protein